MTLGAFLIVAAFIALPFGFAFGVLLVWDFLDGWRHR